MSGLSNLTAKVKDFLAGVESELKKKSQTVSLAENTSKLGNQSFNDLTTLSRTLSTNHANQKNNPHNVTPQQVGSYSTEDFDNIIANYITSGIVPISRYGDLTYSAPGVTGNFEGATTVKIPDTGDVNYNLREAFTFYLEDDGTLMFLRNGTDGSSEGVYYAYVQNAATGVVGKRVVITTRRYRPTFVPVGEYVKYLYQGGNGVVAGMVEKSSDKTKRPFIALMNGTLNDVVHRCTWLGPEWDAILNRSECIVAKDRVLILYNEYAHQNGVNNAPIQFSVYEIPLTNFDNLTVSVPTKLTFGECTGFLGYKSTSGEVRLSQVTQTNNLGVSALVHHKRPDAPLYNGFVHIGGSGRIMTCSAFNPTGDKLRVLVHQLARYTNPSNQFTTIALTYSFVIDLTTMTAALDEGMTPLVLENNAAQTALVVSGGIVGTTSSINLFGVQPHDISIRLALVGEGVLVSSWVRYLIQGSDRITSHRWDNVDNNFELLKAPHATKPPSVADFIDLPTNYGSAIGDSMDGFRLMPGNNAILLTRNNTSTEARVRVRLAPAGQPINPNYTYSSLTYANGLAGLKPTTERITLDNTYPNRLFSEHICVINGENYSSYGSVLKNISGFTSSPVRFNEDLSTVGTVSATMEQLNNLVNQCLVAAGLSTTEFLGTPLVELIIPQEPDAPVYANLMIVTKAWRRYFMMVLVDVGSSRQGVLEKVEYSATIALTDQGVVVGIGSPGNSLSLKNGSHTLYRVAEGYMVVGNSNLFYNNNSNTSVKYKFFYNTTTKATSHHGVYLSNIGIFSTRFIGLPGRGVGDITSEDIHTKIMFRPHAKTLGEFATWTPKESSSHFVLVAQEVAQGWIVYFSEDTPVIINGSSGVVPQTTIDLTTIKANPANTEFFVYVVDDNGSFSYRILPTYVPEDYNTLLIGTITTDNSRIVSMGVDKITKFSGKTLSATPRGQSIPVTGGLPSQAATLVDGWF